MVNSCFKILFWISIGYPDKYPDNPYPVHLHHWLGPPDFSTPSAFFKAHQISKSWLARSETLRNPTRLNIASEVQEEYVEVAKMEFSDEDPTQLWDAVAEIWSRSWWTRTWVVQEACVAPGIVFVSGEAIISWTDLVNMRFAVTQHCGSIHKIPEVATEDVQNTLQRLLIGKVNDVEYLISRM